MAAIKTKIGYTKKISTKTLANFVNRQVKAAATKAARHVTARVGDGLEERIQKAAAQATTRAIDTISRRRAIVETFEYEVIRDGKAFFRGVKTGRGVPEGFDGVFAESQKKFQRVLDEEYRPARIRPLLFGLFSRKTEKWAGRGYFNQEFVDSDPKFYANNLARIDAHLAKRGLRLELARTAFSDDPNNPVFFLGDDEDAKSRPMDADIKPAAKDIMLDFVDISRDLNGVVKISAGDEIPDHLWCYFTNERRRFQTMLDSYSIGSRFRPSTYLLYDASRFTDDGSHLFFEEQGEGGLTVAHRIEKVDQDSSHATGLGFAPIAFGRLPDFDSCNRDGLSADDLAHIATRFGAHDLVFALVPKEGDENAKKWLPY